jgi:uncharacterized protein YbcI
MTWKSMGTHLCALDVKQQYLRCQAELTMLSADKESRSNLTRLQKVKEGSKERERELHKAGAQEARLHRLRVVGQKVVKLHHQLSQEGKLNNQSCKTVFLWMRKWMQVKLLVNH